MSDRATALLLGPACLDRYVAEGLDLPGGGALNMAYHWARTGFPGVLLSRVGDDCPAVFTEFCARHGIRHLPSLVGTGPSSSIEIVVDEHREPHMDHFVEGVWTDFSLTPGEVALLRDTPRLHAVLVGPVTAELDRLAELGALDGVATTGDFLSFRRYPIERFARTMAHLRIGFIGWRGEPDDPVVDEVRAVTYDLGRLVVVTLGARGMLVLDGQRRSDRFVPVAAQPVTGTSVGCGDAFVAAFLASLWSSATADPHDVATVDAALAAGSRAGAAATAWLRPLPDEAYQADEADDAGRT